MRETWSWGDQQVFKERQRQGHAWGERGIGSKESTLESSPGGQALRAEGRSGSWVCRGRCRELVEAKLVKNGDLGAQLKSDVFMNTVGMFRVVLLGPTVSLP